MSHEAHLETELYKKVLAYPPVFSNEIIENYNVVIINFSQYICSVANHIKNKSL